MIECPRVSIVLPTFNGSRFLRQSVESVIAQTFQDWELIIVDDCSTDGTPDIIAELVRSDPRIRSVRHETNRKLPAALNTGFARARGEYLTWTSDDNEYRPTAIETMVGALSSDASVAFVYCRFTVIDAEGRMIRTIPYSPPEHLADDNRVGPCFLYRREVRDRLGAYDEDAFLAEDYDYWLRVYLLFEMRAIDSDAYLYRRHEAALQMRTPEVLAAMDRVLEKHCAALSARGDLLGFSCLRRRFRIQWQLGHHIAALRLARRAMAFRTSRRDPSPREARPAFREEVGAACYQDGFRAYERGQYASALRMYGLLLRWDPLKVLDLRFLRLVASAVKRGVRSRCRKRRQQDGALKA